MVRPLLLALISAIPSAAAQYHFAAVWDGDKVWRDACITVEADLISAAGPAIDLSRFYAIPGMIDVHTHMIYL